MNKKIFYLRESQKKSDDSNRHSLEKLDSNEIALILSANTLILMKHWIKFQQEWINNIYKRFKDYEELLTKLAEIKEHTDNFFDNVVVNDENQDIKNNRLELMAMFCKIFNTYIDFSKIDGI